MRASSPIGRYDFTMTGIWESRAQSVMLKLLYWRHLPRQCDEACSRACKENLMPFRFRAGAVMAIALSAGILAAGFFAPSAFAQTASPQSPAAPAQTPPAPSAAPAQGSGSGASEGANPSGDVFGQTTTLTAKPIVYVKGSGTWDKAFETITAAFKKIDAYLDKEGIKTNGMPMTIFTATDDTGFEYEAAVPVAEAPKNPPRGDIAVGQSPEGTALKFVHRGSYDDLDNTYEAITNYLDDKKLEAKDMFIEEYVTDPVKADAGKLVINVYVLIKPPIAPG
jgi:effector-binding domain-containing protein